MRDSMAELEIAVEAASAAESLTDRVEAELTNVFSLRIPVKLAEPESLPRYEFKSKRWVKT